jgi:hypothetical protein
MDQKVGKVTGPLVGTWTGHLSRLLGVLPLLALMSRGAMVCCSIFPPRTSSDFGVSTLDTASKVCSLSVSTGALEDRRDALDDDPFANFVAAAGHVPRISVPGKEERGVSMVYAVYAPKRRMISGPMPGILQASG